MLRAIRAGRSPLVFAAVLTLGAACAGVPAQDITGGPASTTPCPATAGQELLLRINTVRSEHGLPPFEPHPELVAAARRHTDDMAVRGEVFHVGSDGLAAPERILRAGYRWQATGENVAAGYASAEAVLGAWLESPPHRAVVLDPVVMHAGAGFTQTSTAGPRWFWALNVAAPAEAETTPAVRCHP